MQDDPRARRRAAARRALLSGTAIASTDKSAQVTKAGGHQLDAAFSHFMNAAIQLEALSRHAASRLVAQLASCKTDTDRQQKILIILLRELRGCRVRVTEPSARLNGTTGIVLAGDRGDGDGKLPVRLTVHDGSIQEVQLSPIHLQLVQGREEAEKEETARVRDAASAAAAERLRRLSTSQQPHVLMNELNLELKGKSFSELKLMADKLGAGELLYNPLLRYDKASFREGLAELLVHSDDGGAMLTELLISEDPDPAGPTEHTTHNAREGGGNDEDEEEESDSGAEDEQLVAFGPSPRPLSCDAGASSSSREEERVAGEFGPALPAHRISAPTVDMLPEQVSGPTLPGPAPREEDGTVYGPAAFPLPVPLLPAAPSQVETALLGPLPRPEQGPHHE